MWRVKRFFRRVKRLWAWLPVIWGDEDFDQAFLYRIMAFKLRRMQRVLADDPFHVSSERDARDVQVCANIMERLADDRVFMRERQHLDVFAKIFARKSGGWWT